MLSNFDQFEQKEYYNFNYFYSKLETADDSSKSLVGHSTISNHCTISQAPDQSYMGSPCDSYQRDNTSIKHFPDNYDNSNFNHLELAQNLKINPNQTHHDIFNNGGEILKEEPLTGNGAFIWEFEDFLMA